MEAGLTQCDCCDCQREREENIHRERDLWTDPKLIELHNKAREKRRKLSRGNWPGCGCPSGDEKHYEQGLPLDFFPERWTFQMQKIRDDDEAWWIASKVKQPLQEIRLCNYMESVCRLYLTQIGGGYWVMNYWERIANWKDLWEKKKTRCASE